MTLARMENTVAAVNTVAVLLGLRVALRRNTADAAVHVSVSSFVFPLFMFLARLHGRGVINQ